MVSGVYRYTDYTVVVYTRYCGLYSCCVICDVMWPNWLFVCVGVYAPYHSIDFNEASLSIEDAIDCSWTPLNG